RERHVQAEPHRHRAQRPQPQHRGAGLAAPEERRAPLADLVGEFEPDHVAVELDRALHVGDREVSLEQPVDWSGGSHYWAPLAEQLTRDIRIEARGEAEVADRDAFVGVVDLWKRLE